MTGRSSSSTTVKAKQNSVTKPTSGIADRTDTLRLVSLVSSSNPKYSLYEQRWAEQTCRGRRPRLVLGRIQDASNQAGPFLLRRVTHKCHQGLQIDKKMGRLNKSQFSVSRTTKYGLQAPPSPSLELATKPPHCVSTFFQCKIFCDGDDPLQADILSCYGHPPVGVHIDPASTEQTWS